MSLYSYNLPEEFIAKRPASPRDSSRILIYNTLHDEVCFDRFWNLDKYLPKTSFLVLNNTKVVPARAILKKETGGNVEVLFLVNEWKRGNQIPVIVNKKILVGSKLFFDTRRFFRVIKQEEQTFFLEPNFNAGELLKILNKKGITPIPKYIKNSGLSEKELRKKYQTIFSKIPGSVAAPTASLHFTERLFDKLRKEGTEKIFVTLNVGRGTFAPVGEENITRGTLHREFLSISEKSIERIREQKKKKKPIVAVGTTVVRTLESQAAKILSSRFHGAIVDDTQIFIHPPYDFKIVNILITNFHLPDTSLMMLVEAFLDYKHAKRHLVDLYETAIKEKFRFYSFGDAMVIL